MFNRFSATSSLSTPAQSGTGSSFFGQAQQQQPNPQQLSSVPAQSTSPFNNPFGGAAPVSSMSLANPSTPYAITNELENGVTVKLLSISAMPAYRHLSQDEIRVDDYLKGRKGPSGFPGSQSGAFSQSFSTAATSTQLQLIPEDSRTLPHPQAASVVSAQPRQMPSQPPLQVVSVVLAPLPLHQPPLRLPHPHLAASVVALTAPLELAHLVPRPLQADSAPLAHPLHPPLLLLLGVDMVGLVPAVALVLVVVPLGVQLLLLPTFSEDSDTQPPLNLSRPHPASPSVKLLLECLALSLLPLLLLLECLAHLLLVPQQLHSLLRTGSPQLECSNKLSLLPQASPVDSVPSSLKHSNPLALVRECLEEPPLHPQLECSVVLPLPLPLALQLLLRHLVKQAHQLECSVIKPLSLSNNLVEFSALHPLPLPRLQLIISSVPLLRHLDWPQPQVPLHPSL